MLEQLKAVFDTKQLLELEFQPTSLKRYIGICLRDTHQYGFYLFFDVICGFLQIPG